MTKFFAPPRPGEKDDARAYSLCAVSVILLLSLYAYTQLCSMFYMSVDTPLHGNVSLHLRGKKDTQEEQYSA